MFVQPAVSQAVRPPAFKSAARPRLGPLRRTRYYAPIAACVQRKKRRPSSPSSDLTENGRRHVFWVLSVDGLGVSHGRLLIVRIGKVAVVRRPLQPMVCSGRLTLLQVKNAVRYPGVRTGARQLLPASIKAA